MGIVLKSGKSLPLVGVRVTIDEDMVDREWTLGTAVRAHRGVFLGHEVAMCHISMADSQGSQDHFLVAAPATR